MEKYLRQYAEPEVAGLDELDDGLLDGFLEQKSWAHVLVVPACNETAEFLREPPPCDGRSLLILVINESATATKEVSVNNLALAATVQARFTLLWQSSPKNPEPGSGFGLYLFRDPATPRDVLLVDRFSEGCKLPVRGGVGYARKIGTDLAASLIQRKKVRSAWIHCSDADVHLPDTYFTRSEKVQPSGHVSGTGIGSKYAALLYPFHHCDELDKAESSEVVLATQMYELSLRYYVAGMKFAGSPYAFHTIGSTMAVNANHYAKVRGFPKREAGEDFYLLNKLAKVGSVLELAMGPDCDPIEIEARRSDRVPFGTGAAVNKITALIDPIKEFRFYHPAVFELLQRWLRSLPVIWQSRSGQLTSSVFIDLKDDDQCASQLSLMTGLKNIGTEKALDHAFRQSKDLDQFNRQMHTWFDAFRTLKLIHTLRDHYLPSISYSRLIAHQIFAQLLIKDPELMVFHQQFRQRLLATTETTAIIGA